jgi:prephenate dehydrogenase
MALSAKRFAVTLEDPSPTAANLARDLGAGALPGTGPAIEPAVVVVAAPPDVAADVVADALGRWEHAVVTDVASVKESVLVGVLGSGAEATRYVGSHPMVGRVRSGVAASRGDLFHGRAWVVVPHRTSRPDAVVRVRQLAAAVGAAVRIMSAREHDAAVAAVLHVPQLASSIVAASLHDRPDEAVALAGQGLRDVTRLAECDPRLWTQILSGNAAAARDVLRDCSDRLDAVLTALDTLIDRGGEDSLGALSTVLEAGNAGCARIPGKHGAAPTAYREVSVVVPDEPGAIARLLTQIGAAGINVEDLHLEHGHGRPFGIAVVSVVPAAAEPLRGALTNLSWRILD